MKTLLVLAAYVIIISYNHFALNASKHSYDHMNYFFMQQKGYIFLFPAIK